MAQEAWPGGWGLGGQVPGPGSDPEGWEGQAWEGWVPGLRDPGGSGARTWRSWGPGRVARTVPEGQAPGGKIAKIAKIAIFPFSCVFFSIKMAIFRKTRVLAGFFHFSGHPDRKNGVRTRIWA